MAWRRARGTHAFVSEHGQEHGLGISAKITAIVTVVLAGLATGTTIFCAQYWGSADAGRIRQVFGLGLGLGAVFSGGMTALVAGFPTQVFAPFTSSGSGCCSRSSSGRWSRRGRRTS